MYFLSPYWLQTTWHSLERVLKPRSCVQSANVVNSYNMRRHELSEAQWNRIKDLLPPERKPQGGRPAKSSREMLNAMVYWLNTGIP